MYSWKRSVSEIWAGVPSWAAGGGYGVVEGSPNGPLYARYLSKEFSEEGGRSDKLGCGRLVLNLGSKPNPGPGIPFGYRPR